MMRLDLRLTREERGQSIVLFVITFTALMGLLALVVNVGYWFQNQRRLQTVADATAMEAAQSNHDTFGELTADAPVAAAGDGDTRTGTARAHAVPVQAGRRNVPVRRAKPG